MEISEEDIKIYLRSILDKKAFYNPQMKIVRSLNVEIYKSYAKEGYKFLDLLASIGANSLRIKKAIPYLEVYSNDISKDAIEYLRKNAELNKLELNILNLNAKHLYCTLKEKFNIIDIDPFGSPVNFLPYILELLNKETLLSLTATDVASLGGKYESKCLMRYGIFTVETDMLREMAIRNLIVYTMRFFSSFNYLVHVIFSYSEKHFIKVYVLLKKSSSTKIQKNIKENLGFISFCKNCLNKKVGIEEKCDICNTKLDHIGITYLGKLFDENFVQNCIKNSIYEETKKIFTNAIKDFSEDYTLPPLTFDTHQLAKKLKTNVLGANKLLEIFKNKNLKISKSYLDSRSVRTSNFKDLLEEFGKK